MDKEIREMLLVVILLVLLIALLTQCSRKMSREKHNMVPIESGYAYDRETKLIYIESESDMYGLDFVYTIYVNANGHYCKYEVSTGLWVEME